MAAFSSTIALLMVVLPSSVDGNRLLPEVDTDIDTIKMNLDIDTMMSLDEVGSRSESTRSDSIEVGIAASVQASLKNDNGRLDHDAAASVVQRFFARDHAWSVNATLLSTAVRNADRGSGLSTRDVVKVVEGIELSAAASVSASATEDTRKRCDSLQAALLDQSYPGTGRVPVDAVGESDLIASEGIVERIGAKKHPFVLVANYMALLAHCSSSGEIQSQCCASNCETTMSALESELQAPLVSADRLLRVLSEVSGSTFQPRLQAQLRLIAKSNDGDVVLHSQQFAEWLHYAFPTSCPLPSAISLNDAWSMSCRMVNRFRMECDDEIAIKDFGESYTVDTMLNSYVTAELPESTIVKSSSATGWKKQDLARVFMMGLMALAGLHTAVGYWRAASTTLKASTQDVDLKKPKLSSS